MSDDFSMMLDDVKPAKVKTPTLLFTKDYRGRVYQGWSVVEWRGLEFHHSTIVKWIEDNCANRVIICPIGWKRFFFEDQEDALMCYMAFR